VLRVKGNKGMSYRAFFQSGSVGLAFRDSTCSLIRHLAWRDPVTYNRLMSEAIAFDTHRFVKNLTASGFTEKQAEALANEQVQLLNANLATKADILAIKADITVVKAELEVKIETVKSELEAKLESIKGDILAVKGELEVKIETVKGELLKWMVMAMIAQGGLIVALIKAL